MAGDPIAEDNHSMTSSDLADSDLETPTARPFAPVAEGERDRRAVHGGIVLMASNAATTIVEIAATMALARLLTPADFGLLAMVWVLMTFVGKFRDFGLTSATVQTADLDSTTASLLFWANMKLCAVLAVGMAASAPLLSLLFGEPRLTVITLIMTASVFIVCLGTVHQGLLMRNLRFKTVTAIKVGTTLAGAVAGVASALAGAGYWALVIQHVVREVLQGLSLMLCTGWWPTWLRPTADTRARIYGMLKYGGNLSAANVVAFLGRNLDFVLVGTLAGATSLGLYHKAFRWAAEPFQQLYLPTMNVALTKFSRLQDSADRYRTSFNRTMLALFTVLVPLMALLFVEAQAVILTLMGDQWMAAVPLFRILLFGTFCNGLLLILKWVYKSEGRTARHLHWTLISSPILAGGIALGGVVGANVPHIDASTAIALAFTITSLLLVYPGVVFCFNASPLRKRDLFRPMLTPFVASGIAAGITYGTAVMFAFERPILRLLVSAAVMAVSYVVVYLVLPMSREHLRELRIAFDPLLQRFHQTPSPDAGAAD